jgi:hypothetical protein
VVSADGATGVQRARRARRPPVDCFYVYPTVSAQPTLNANLRIDPELTNVARSQASRFSQVCRIYAPVYRQLTIAGIFAPATREERQRAQAVAYAGVRSAWREYLARFNRGRGVILIGHSQGTSMLRRLARERIDSRPRVRRRLVSALLLGGNVVVRMGRDRGGDFRRIPACRSASQTGCVVAYSSFDVEPSAAARFGRAGALFGGPSGPNMRALCVNPATLVGGGALRPYYTANRFSGLLGGIGPLPSVRTVWASFPGLYRARCRQAGDATWLQIDDVGGADDPRPRVRPTPTPDWGLHFWDVNLALGNLVELTERQVAAYLRRRPVDS